MTIADIFYLTATVSMIVMGLVSVYVAYLFYKLWEYVQNQKQNLSDMVRGAAQSKYAMQIALFKFVLRMLKGRAE